eukprot:1339649-Prymnesium_polylepis.1
MCIRDSSARLSGLWEASLKPNITEPGIQNQLYWRHTRLGNERIVTHYKRRLALYRYGANQNLYGATCMIHPIKDTSVEHQRPYGAK